MVHSAPEGRSIPTEQTENPAAHSPGPWVARDETNRGAIYSASAYPGRPIATTSSYWQGDGPRSDERQANANLIAAAPEMLAALKWIEAYARVQVMRHADARDFEGWKNILDAIAKAEGKPPV